MEQGRIDSVQVEVTEDISEDGNRPNSELENPSLEFYGLTAI
jgi:hypothetical protein